MRSSIRLAAVTVTAAAMVGMSSAAAHAAPWDRGGDSLSQASLQSCIAVEQEGEAEVKRSWFSDAEAENTAVLIAPAGVICNQASAQVVAPVTVFGTGNTAGWIGETGAEGDIIDVDITAPENGLEPVEPVSDANTRTLRMVEGALAGNAGLLGAHR
ncbi:hypothetical protein GCM10009716_37420 [Streptomyces sodiiphilus]|uniref:Secreted protein n=1 Tax=Streptomyces sodiiphilus TaxID=226217 RepID=A0ABN2PP34_9ACTN